MKAKTDDNLKFVPVPRRKINYTNQDALSKKLRRLDNLKIETPIFNQTGIYINTNEQGVSQNYLGLRMFPTILQPIHIGFSGWQNFDIIAQRKSGRAIICDINPENALFLSFLCIESINKM